MNIYLCSGIGGQAVKNEENITLDLDPKVKPSIVADVKHLPLRKGLKPKNLLLTPPCTHFSYAQPFPRKGIGRAFETLGACMEAINWLQPETWILENPCNHLQRFLGKPKYGVRWQAGEYRAIHQFWGTKSLKRSVIPPEITRELLD